jgi:hypothetical protein
VETHAGDAAPLTRGDLLDGRYRLESALGDRAGGGGRLSVWRAVDITLDRTVAVTVLRDGSTASRQRLLDSAAAAGSVADARFTRVLDAGTTDDATPVTWVAAQWVDGPSLTALVNAAPLPAPVATDVVRQCAEALATAQSAGIAVGLLTPDRVFLPPGGAARVTGLALDPDGDAVTSADEVRSLGGVLYAALTGRWPLSGWNGLPAVVRRSAADPRPRQVRAGIPRELDDVTRRALMGEYGDAHRFARALAALPSIRIDSPPAPPDRARAEMVRRWLWRVVPPLVIVAVGLAGWTAGRELGRLPESARQNHAALPPAKSVGPDHARVRLVWRRPPAIRSFDPAGDGEENDAAAGLAVDRDPTTEWTTDTYRGDPHLGGLKPGVGLLLDLGRPRPVSVAELVLSAPGADVEVRAGDQPPGTADDLPVVGSRHAACDRVRLTLAHRVQARYWLVWFTSLPPASDGFRIGVAELALLG